MRNQPEWIVAFYGAALAGAIATPLNAWWSAAEFTYAIKQSGAVLAVLDEERFARMGEALAECTGLRGGFVSGLAEGTALPPASRRFETMLGPVPRGPSCRRPAHRRSTCAPRTARRCSTPPARRASRRARWPTTAP